MHSRGSNQVERLVGGVREMVDGTFKEGGEMGGREEKLRVDPVLARLV